MPDHRILGLLQRTIPISACYLSHLTGDSITDDPAEREESMTSRSYSNLIYDRASTRRSSCAVSGPERPDHRGRSDPMPVVFGNVAEPEFGRATAADDAAPQKGRRKIVLSHAHDAHHAHFQGLRFDP